MKLSKFALICFVAVAPLALYAASGYGSAYDSAPVPIKRFAPEYPSEMKKKDLTGEVVVEFIVEKDGSVQMAKVVKQTNAAFGRVAVAAVKKWKFTPALKAGAPVRFAMQAPISFARVETPSQQPQAPVSSAPATNKAP